MKVDVNKVRETVAWLQKIDRANFEDIEWVDGDKEIKVTESFAHNFSDTGLRPTDFALTDLYKQ